MDRPSDLEDPYGDLTDPVSLQALAAGPDLLPGLLAAQYLEMDSDDVGKRTLMGVGARAVRAVATSGMVEARPARGPQATPAGPSPLVVQPEVDSPAPARVPSARVIVSFSEDPPVQPVPLAPEALSLLPATETPPAWAVAATSAQLAEAMRLIAPAVQPAPAAVPEPARAARPGLRVLAVGALALAAAAVAAYLATIAFYTFSTRWAMPVVISPSDEKVVALRSGLAAQQHQRDRLAAELEAAARVIAVEPDPRSAVVAKARAQQQVLQASIARHDEIIRGLEQAPQLRALADRASVAVVPYDNLESVTQGTKLFACRVAMLVCREVGRVRAILPGEIAFKHPRRDKAMRGKMIDIELSAPAAAAEDVLFLGGAPLLF